ncbi:nicotinamide N-methyltransferase-like [Gastrophryne carolinensis]
MSAADDPQNYQKRFNPNAYLDMYFRLAGDSVGDEYMLFVLKHLAQIFNSGLVKGKTLIDIGTGPSIYSLLSACEEFEDIIVSDFTDSNREAFKDWLLDRPGAFDWSPVVKHVCHLEGDRTPFKEKEARLKKAIKQVVECNILKCPPIEEAVPQADCILSSLCLESACKDDKDYVAALGHMTSLLKPRGYLVLTGDMGNSYYTVGDVKFSCFTLTESFVRKSVSGAGFTILKLELFHKKEESLVNFSAFYVLVARKNETPFKEKEARLKKAIKQVVECNILKSPPIEEAVLQADCILSSLCLESTCKDDKDYVAALGHMTSLLKPGGYLVLTGDMGNSYYTVGDVKFSSFTLTESFVRKSVSGAGFTGFTILNFSIKRKNPL